jgi:hypothetical protein
MIDWLVGAFDRFWIWIRSIFGGPPPFNPSGN